MESKKRNGGDRLSALPEMVLQHILSFLDMRMVVQTCVLSKTWNSIWVSFPTLNFLNESKGWIDNDGCSPSWNDCTDWRFVDNVFIHRDGSNIQKLKFVGYNISSPVNTRVLAAIRHNLQELDINLLTSNCIHRSKLDLPYRLFTCQTLSTLKLVGSPEYVRDAFRLPDSIHLPRLKKLHLELLLFHDENVLNFFLSNCPVVEYLVVLNIFLDQKKGEDLIISIATLKYLRIECYRYPMKLYSSRLESLSLRGSLMNQFTVCVEIPFLENIELVMESDCSNDIKKHNVYDITRLLQDVLNLKALVLSAPCIKMISEMPSDWTVQFYCLKHMKLKTTLSTDCIRAIKILLKASPYIETLIIEWIFVSVPSNPVFCKEDAPNSLGLMLNHLKVIELRGFKGWIHEFRILEILLKVSVILKTLVLDSKRDAPNEEKKRLEFSEKLLEFPRASPNISILFL